MINLNDGKEHIVTFSKGDLFIDDKKVAGKDIFPQKDIVFKFKTNAINTPVENPAPKIRDAEFTDLDEDNPPDLSIDVHDTVKGKAMGPGQL